MTETLLSKSFKSRKILQLWFFLYQYFDISGYGAEAKTTFLQTAILAKDEPISCTRNATISEDKTSGYARRKKLVEKSQVVPFATR